MVTHDKGHIKVLMAKPMAKPMARTGKAFLLK
jgi:hypothetical protein